MSRTRLEEIYNVAKPVVERQLNEWRKVSGRKNPTFSLNKVKTDKNMTLEEARTKFYDDVNRTCIRATMTDNDVEWVTEEVINNLNKEQKDSLWLRVYNELKAEPSMERNVFKATEYNVYLTYAENVKAYKRWKARIIRELKNVA